MCTIYIELCCFKMKWFYFFSDIKRKKMDTSPITKVRTEVWSQHNHNSIPIDIYKTNNK